MSFASLLKNPFRLFFPLGLLAGVLGVALWLPLAADGFNVYPVQSHRLLMIGGFLLSFVVGFLTTAIPGFTSSFPLRRWEFLLLTATLSIGIVSALFALPLVYHVAVSLTFLVLMVFAIRRFQARDENPPFTFVFVGAGLVLWALASVVLAVHQVHRLTPILFEPARAVYMHGALTCLVIGVGGRLIPGIFGWNKMVMEQRNRYENADNYAEEIPKTLLLTLFVFLVSYGLEGLLQAQFLWLIRAGVLSYVAVRYWALYRPPKIRTGLTWGIWFSCWSFLLGMLIPVAWPSGGVHGIHMVFIGGFSLLTILVATRVILAHGSHGMELESTSWTLKTLIGLYLVSMFTRVTSILWPSAYRSHLGYAAFLWILASLLWTLLMFPRIVDAIETS